MKYVRKRHEQDLREARAEERKRVVRALRAEIVRSIELAKYDNNSLHRAIEIVEAMDDGP